MPSPQRRVDLDMIPSSVVMSSLPIMLLICVQGFKPHHSFLCNAYGCSGAIVTYSLRFPFKNIELMPLYEAMLHGKGGGLKSHLKEIFLL